MKNKIERRYGTVEWRADEEDNRTIKGIASVVGDQYRVGWFDEIIERGAFDNALKESDVKILFNHNPSLIVGRSGKNGAKVFTDGNGNLAYEFEAPKTTAGNDLLENVRSGLVSQSSFGFDIVRKGDEWSVDENGRDVRTVLKNGIKTLYDVSPVTYPASPTTSVSEARFAEIHGIDVDNIQDYVSERNNEVKPKEEVKPNADSTSDQELVYNNLENFKRKISISKKKYK